MPAVRSRPARGPTRPPVQQPPAPRTSLALVSTPQRLALTQACASAALCATGTTAGGLATLAELGQQYARPDRGLVFGAAGLTLGVAGGLWIPRQIIRRRLAASTQPPRAVVADSDFAASLSGSAVLVLALLWCGLLAWTAGAESWRAWIAGRFLWPAEVKLAVVVTPAAVGLFAAGLLGTITLVSLHGWYRALSFPRMPLAWLWLTLLGGSAAGAALAVTLEPRWLPWAAVLTLFMAAWVTGLRPRSTPTVRPVTPALGPLPWRDLAWTVALVFAAASWLGIVQRFVMQHTHATPAALGQALIWTACGALAGPLLGRVPGLRRHAIPAALAAIVASVGIGLSPRIPTYASLPATCGLISLAIVLAVQDAARRLASVQQALTTCGLIVSAGFLAGLLAAGPWLGRPIQTPASADRVQLPPAVRRAAGLLPADQVRQVATAEALAGVDLHEPPPRVLIVSAPAAAGLDADRVGRIATRLVRVLGPHGRIVSADPSPVGAWLLRQRQRWPATWRAYTCASKTRTSVLLIGPDIPAWLAYARTPDEPPLRLQRR